MSVRRKIEIAPKPSTTRNRVGHLKRWFAEKFFRALLFELDQLAQDERSGSGRDEPVLGGDVRFRFAGDVFEDFFKILQIEQWQMFVVAEFIDERDEARLCLVEPEHAGEEERSELEHRRPEVRARFIRKGKKFHRIGAGRPIRSDLCLALGDGRRRRARHGQAAEIAFDIHQQRRDARLGELLGDHLERLGFPGASCAGNEAVAIHRSQRQPHRRLGEDFAARAWPRRAKRRRL